MRVLRDDAYGNGEGAQDLEKTSYWRCQQDKLPTSAGFGNKSVTEVLGVAGREISNDETLQRGASNNVFGKLGHQDSFRRGEAGACFKNYGKPRPTRMVDCGIFT